MSGGRVARIELGVFISSLERTAREKVPGSGFG